MCFKNPEKQLHANQPIPDPQDGRPHLNWKKCRHYGCGRLFNSDNALVAHLTENDNYTPSFHICHEKAVEYLGLTPEKVLQESISRCPSFVCTEQDKHTTPEKLITHLKILGIPPFWKEGDVITMSDMNSNSKLNTNKYKVYNNDCCAICYSEDVECVLQPCNHNISCLSCTTMFKNMCPFCQTKIENIIPF
jgi:hypothetical protein